MPTNPNLTYGKVTGFYSRVFVDGTDSDAQPENVPLEGLQLLFTPSQAVLVNPTAKATIQISPFPATTDENGYVCTPAGDIGIELPASIDPLINETGWTWNVTISGAGYPRETYAFTLSGGQEIDLSTVVKLPSSIGTSIVQWEAAVAATQAAAIEAGASAEEARALIAAMPEVPTTAAEVGAEPAGLSQATKDAQSAKLAPLNLGVSVVTAPAFGAVAAVAIRDAVVAAGSTSITSPSGKFTASMNGQYFYLRKGGPVLIGGGYAWEASPLVGTFTYVSATAGTLSVAATTAVNAGEIIVGPDAAPGITAAIAQGRGFIPVGVDLIVATEIVIGSNRSLSGGSRATSRLFSVVPKANVIVSSWTVAPEVRDLSVYGNGWGAQPANTDPGTGIAPNWANSGCGIIFAKVTSGRIENVDVFHHGGDAVTTDRNGISGIYVTMGCIETKVLNSSATYCRNGINEDNYFSGAGQLYNPIANTFDNNTTNYNRFGIALDSGSLARGATISNHVSRFNFLYGIDVHSCGYVTISNPRVEYNGRGSTLAPGIAVYGTSSTVTAANVTITGAVCFANGTHGIKVSDWVQDWKIIGGTFTKNFGPGIYVNNQANNGIISGVSCRDNGLSGNGDSGIRITSSLNISVDANSFDDQGTPTQAWGLYVDGSADYITVSDTSRFSGNALGPIRLSGANSKIGGKSRAQIVAAVEGIKGEAFSRILAPGAFVPTSGQLRATLVGLLAGETVANLMVHSTAVGAGLTLSKLGLFTAAGVLVASTADASATFTGSTGIKSVALTTPYVVPADGGYYIGHLFVGTTAPTLIRGTSGIAGFTPSGPSGTAMSAQSGLADLPSTHTIGASGTAPWFAWS